METIEDLSAEFDAFEPTDDSSDNEERLQILVDRWEQTPDKESALPSIFGIFERNPESQDLGNPGPLVHAIEQVPAYEVALAASLAKAPSYYAVWMVNRILGLELPSEVRASYVELLKQAASSEAAPESVRQTALEFLEFQGT